MISKGSLVQYTPTLDGPEGVGPIMLTITDPYVRHPRPPGAGRNVYIVDVIDDRGDLRRFPVTGLIKVQ